MPDSKISIAVACICFATSGAVSAGTGVHETAPDYANAMTVKLAKMGYRDVRIVNPETLWFVGTDQDGSEVKLKVHPTNYKILDINYIHDLDN